MPFSGSVVYSPFLKVGVGVRAVISLSLRDDAVAVGLRCAGGGDDAVHEIGIRDGPLEGLLRAHGEADDGT